LPPSGKNALTDAPGAKPFNIQFDSNFVPIHLMPIGKHLTVSTAPPRSLSSCPYHGAPGGNQGSPGNSTLAEIKRFIRRKYAVIVSYI